MEKKTLKLLKNLFLFFLIPAGLLLSGVVFSLFFNPLESFSTLHYPSNNVSYTQMPSMGIIEDGDVIKGTFQSKDENLSTIMLNFDYNSRQIEDFEIVFKIKKDSEGEWFYQVKRHSQAFALKGYYVLGFPIINSQAGEKIDFEVQFNGISKKSTLTVDDDNFLAGTSYKFSKSVLLTSKQDLVVFSSKKIFLLLTNVNTLINLNMYFIAFVLYVIALLYFYKKLITFPLLILGLIFVDILLIWRPIELITVSLAVLFIATIHQHKLASKWIFINSFIVFSLCIIFSFFRFNALLAKASIWLYLFLVIFAFIELKKLNKN